MNSAIVADKLPDYIATYHYELVHNYVLMLYYTPLAVLHHLLKSRLLQIMGNIFGLGEGHVVSFQK